MRKLSFAAFALVLAGLTGPAGAFTSVATDVTTNTTWGAAGSPYILQRPIFVKNGATLTIEKGVVVRGQPRTAAVMAGSTVGTPGALIVTQTGKINAVGTAAEPIIFTTAAIDNNNDNEADVCGSFKCPFTGTETFYDDSPLTAPLAPLSPAGAANVTLWGGVALLGNAPTNLGEGFGVGQGKGILEGLTIPGFPVTDATFGGTDPHDDSGRMIYVSIRHGGDEIGEGNELNCLSLGGVGDLTEISHVECSANFDDGFEWFGGTVDADHLAGFYIGDDTFDLDLGYTGIVQFAFGIMPTFNVAGGGNFGSRSGDKGGEWDGDDTVEPGGVNVRLEDPSDGAAADLRPWPFSNPIFYNLTLIGSSPDAGVVNCASSPNAANRGIDMRNGYAGRLANSIIVDTGSENGIEVRVGDGSLPGFSAPDNAAAGDIEVIASTFDGITFPGGATKTALDNGDAVRCSLGATPCSFVSENLVNGVFNTSGAPGAFLGLAQPIKEIDPTGNASGKLDASVLCPSAPGPIDPRPVGILGVSGGMVPQGPGVDAAATFRGAFEPGAPTWTGFTSLGKAGLIAP